MRVHFKRLTLLCAGTMLVACADLGRQLPLLAGPAAPAARPAVSADEAYLIARTAHLAGRHAEALASYQSSLLADPEHVNARNGLATLHAEQGALHQAIPLWRKLTTSATGPESAFLFSNLGYAHFLNGDYDSAMAALEQACLLDPLNHKAWLHLGKALEKVGQHGRAELMYRQAAALQAHDFKADYAAVGRAGITAIDKALEVEPERGQEWAATEVRQDANGVYELHRVGLARKALPAAPIAPVAPDVPLAPPVPVAQLGGRAMLEIRNGNGVKGMARSLSRKMDSSSLRVVRLSNEKGFRVRQTRVEYQPAFRAAATRLAGRFGNVSLVQIADAKSADLRLVIGRDLRNGKFALQPIGKDAPASFVGHQMPLKPSRDNGADQTTSGAQP